MTFLSSFINATDFKSDTFSKIFTLNKKILIDESVHQIKSISDMKISKLFGIYILESRQTIVHLDDKGKNLNIIAKPGNGPGELGQVENVDIDSKNNIWFVDSNKSAIQILSKDGKFIKQCRFTEFPSQIFIGPKDEIYVGLHAIKGGCKLARFFAEEKPYKCLMKESGRSILAQGFILSGFPVTVDGKGNIYAADPMEYKIRVFNTEGKKINEFGTPDKEFGAYTPPPEGGPASKRFMDWSETISTILEIIMIKDRHLGVVWYKGLFVKDRKLVMDIYSLEGKKIASTVIPDNLKLRTSDKDGNLYFTKDEISDDGVDVKLWIHQYTPGKNSLIK